MKHGTYSGRKHHGCDCTPCMDAAYRYRKAHRTGTAAPRKIDATGTRRRIQALYRMGWDTATIARLAGWDTQQAVSVLTSRRVVLASTAATIRGIYDEHAMTPGPSPKARQMAVRRGLPGPLAWDEHTIDDPAATPNVGETGGLGPGRRVIHIEDVEFLLSRDTFTWDGLADRLGCTRASLERTLYRHGRHDLTQKLYTNTRGYRKATAA